MIRVAKYTKTENNIYLVHALDSEPFFQLDMALECDVEPSQFP